MEPAKKKQRLSGDGTVAVEASVDETANSSLFVRSLPSTTTSESLIELFSESYPVKHAVAVADPDTKQCRGYGFVTFADANDATRAKEQFHGHLLDGRKLRIEVAERRHRNGELVDLPKAKHKEEVARPLKLIVRNLPWSIKKAEDLSKLFLSYGKVKQCYIPKKGPGLMAGFGFVIMRGTKNAEKALAGVNGKEVDGRTLAVDWAVDKALYKDEPAEENKEELSSSEDGEESGFGHLEDDEAADHSLEDNDVDADDADADEATTRDDNDDMEDTDRGHQMDDTSSTLFVRNLAFTCTDEDLEDHFGQFGSTRYARVVMDNTTGRSKGTGFVCFYNKADATACLRNAPVRLAAAMQQKDGSDSKAPQQNQSILQNEYADPSGQYTLDGRVLQLSMAVNKSEANRLTDEGTAQRYKRDTDKRRLFLLSEGTISSKSKLWDELSPSERAMRESSAKQRKALIESNPSLHMSMCRLSIRNLPRSINSKDLKALAVAGVVGFASDVKAGTRQKISREELARGGEEMQEAETARKKSGKGIVKQAKVVFESAGGTKISEDAGAGRSRGYGFIEYHTHRNALMGLRWLNGHAVGYQVKEGNGKLSREDIQDRKKRLIVEFAIENAQVVMRRNEIEQKARARSLAVKQGLPIEEHAASEKTSRPKTSEKDRMMKRKRLSEVPASSKTKGATLGKDKSEVETALDDKQARRNQIIGRKRAKRHGRNGIKK